MPPLKFKPKRRQNKKAEALARLRQRWQQEHENEEWNAKSEPAITPMLKAVEGGIPKVLEALRMHDDDDARTFLEAWDQCTKTDRRYLRVEDAAFASGVGSLRLAEVAQTALFLYGQMTTKMLLSSAMPKVMKSTIKAATDEVPITAMVDGINLVVGKTNGDVRAMEMFHKMSGMMPLPKGAQIAIQNNFGEDREKPALAAGWKDADQRLREFQELTEPKRLPSPETAPVAIGGHIDHLQEETINILRGE